MFKHTLITVAAAGFAMTPAMAQVNAGNLVNVNVSQVMVGDILSKNNVDVALAVPVTVQLPIAVAANICDVAVNVLATQNKQGGTPSCDAKSTNDAVSQQVVRQISTQRQ